MPSYFVQKIKFIFPEPSPELEQESGVFTCLRTCLSIMAKLLQANMLYLSQPKQQSLWYLSYLCVAIL